jgi:hypothetical protein
MTTYRVESGFNNSKYPLFSINLNLVLSKATLKNIKKIGIREWRIIIDSNCTYKILVSLSRGS